MKTIHPVISIIIPHKNSIKTLRRLLKSIPIDPRIQVIVIDDNSKSEQKASLIKEEFAGTIFLENRGHDHNAGAARNIGLDVASGTWLLFADADDYFIDNALLTILSKTPSYKDFDIVYFLLTSINEFDGGVGDRHIEFNRLVNLYLSGKDCEVIRYKWSSPWGKLIKRSLQKDNFIFFDSVIAGNDVNFSLKAGFHAKKITCIKQEIYCITRSEGTLTSDISTEKALSRLQVISNYNLFVLRRKVNARLYMGITYFLKTKPWFVTKKKMYVYKIFLFMYASRVKSYLALA